MAVVALIALVAYIAVTFGWRIWLQRRWTGDTGVRAAPRTGSEWLAGVGLVLGTIAVLSAPVLDLTGALARSFDHPLTRIAGVACFALGFWLTVRAQLDMGASWRIGVDSEEVTALVTGGVFRTVRNPIFSGMILCCAGAALMVPNAAAFAGLALLALALEVHVRWVEEPHLVAVHGDQYRSYARSAGRFIPRCGLLDR